MKEIRTFIIEKLHLNKDIKLSNKVLDEIEYYTGCNGAIKEFTKIFKDWIEYNNVEDVSFYMTNDSKQTLINEYELPNEFFAEINVNDAETEKLQSENKTVLFKNVNNPTTIYGNTHVLAVYRVFS